MEDGVVLFYIVADVAHMIFIVAHLMKPNSVRQTRPVNEMSLLVNIANHQRFILMHAPNQKLLYFIVAVTNNRRRLFQIYIFLLLQKIFILLHCFGHLI